MSSLFAANFAEAELDDYDIVYPSLVSEQGDFLSHGVHAEHVHRFRRSLDSNSSSNTIDEQPLFYKLKLNSNSSEFHLKLSPSKDILSPGFVIERQSGKIEHYETSCLYRGQITGQEKSIVAISNCDGLVSSFTGFLFASYLQES